MQCTAGAPVLLVTFMLNGVKTLRTQDTSDPKHFGTLDQGQFGPKTFRHHQTGAEVIKCESAKVT